MRLGRAYPSRAWGGFREGVAEAAAPSLPSSGGVTVGVNRFGLAWPSRAFGFTRGLVDDVVVGPSLPVDLSGVRFTNWSGPAYLAWVASTDKRAYLDNAYTVLQKIERVSPQTGLLVGVPGLQLTAYLGATADATAPIGELSAALTDGGNGVYAVVFPRAAVAALAPYVDQTVYEIIVSADAELRVVNPVLVRGLRMGG